MGTQWFYKNCKIKDGLKPEGKHFQYYYVVSEGSEKKCNYCIWIVDEALSKFNKSRDFNAIVSTQRDDWNKWVKGNIDSGDFRNKVLKFEKVGKKEIELSEMTEHLSLDN